MYIVLVYRPEARSYNLPHNSAPFDGVEVLGGADTSEDADELVEAFRLGNPSWFNVTAGDVVCDFCSHPEVVKLYSIAPGGVVFALYSVFEDDSEHSETHGDSDGLWGACAECHKLISADDWDELAVRSVRQAVTLAAGVPTGLLAYTVRHAHGYFRNAWIKAGKPEPRDVIPDSDFMSRHGIQP